MTEAGCEPVAMTDLDHISIAALPARNRHLAVRRRSHWIASIAPQINTGMDRKTAQDRVHSFSEWRCHICFADGRIAHRNCGQRPAVAVNLRPSRVDAI